MSTLGSGGIALLCLTLVCWILAVIYLFGVTGHEAHGDAVVGQAIGYFGAMGFTGLAWLWLGGLLLKAGTEGVLPAWATTPATVLFFGSGLAMAAALFLIQDPKRIWPAFIPALIPPLLAFYVLALYLPSLRPFFGGTSGSLAIWIPVIVLSLAPLPSAILEIHAIGERRSAREKDMGEWQLQEQARKRAENLTKVQAMSADAPLQEWFSLLSEDSGVSKEAFEAVRHVQRRQADMVDMLPYGLNRAMTLLPYLDLQPTPELCEAAKQFMLKTAKESRVRPKQDPRSYSHESGFEDFIPAIQWLQQRGCDCEEGVAALEACIQTFIESPERNKAIAAFAALRKK